MCSVSEEQMNDRFFELKKEKQDRMINAACRVLAVNGYSNSSTDNIVKAASISKGLLFHYFGSKQGMFSFVYDFCERYAQLELRSSIREPSKDYFRLQEQIIGAQVTIMRQYPFLLLFLETASLETDPELKELMKATDVNYRDVCLEMADKTETPDGYSPAEIQRLGDLLHRVSMHYIRCSLMQDQFDPDQYEEYMLSCLELLKRNPVQAV